MYVFRMRFLSALPTLTYPLLKLDAMLFCVSHWSEKYGEKWFKFIPTDYGINILVSALRTGVFFGVCFGFFLITQGMFSHLKSTSSGWWFWDVWLRDIDSWVCDARENWKVTCLLSGNSVNFTSCSKKQLLVMVCGQYH